MKVAIVHDWLTNMGGAENVVIELKKMFPDAPIYTSVYKPENLAPELQNIDVRPSYLQKNKKIVNNHQKYLHLFPAAFESFDLNEYDVVISSSSSCAHGVITNPNTIHICYCHTPMRYGWEFYYEYTKNLKGIKKKLIPYVMNYIRMWDKVSADRVDYFIANSNYVSNRIKKHYRKESTVIYPPVRTDFFHTAEKKEYYLVLSRLVQYKKIDIAIEAFNELGFPLVIIGTGPEEVKLKRLAKSNVTFLGRLSDEEIKKYYAEAKAFIFPGEEDFGITPVEAQASGTPVIAYGKGGVTETVRDNLTGVLFYNQTKESLIDAIKKFELMNFDKNLITNNATQFDSSQFKSKFMSFFQKVVINHENSNY